MDGEQLTLDRYFKSCLLIKKKGNNIFNRTTSISC